MSKTWNREIREATRGIGRAWGHMAPADAGSQPADERAGDDIVRDPVVGHRRFTLGEPGSWSRVLLAYWSSILLLTLVVTAGAGALAEMQTPIYKSQAVVAVYATSSGGTGALQSFVMGTEKGVASSGAVLSVASQSLLIPVGTLQHGLSITVPADTDLLLISFSDPNPQVAPRARDRVGPAARRDGRRSPGRPRPPGPGGYRGPGADPPLPSEEAERHRAVGHRAQPEFVRRGGLSQSANARTADGWMAPCQRAPDHEPRPGRQGHGRGQPCGGAGAVRAEGCPDRRRSPVGPHACPVRIADAARPRQGGQWIAFRRLLAQLRSEADFVVIDAPPVLASADTAALAELGAMILLVADARASTRAEVRDATRQLGHVRDQVIGCVLDNVGRAHRLRQPSNPPLHTDIEAARTWSQPGSGAALDQDILDQPAISERGLSAAPAGSPRAELKREHGATTNHGEV